MLRSVDNLRGTAGRIEALLNMAASEAPYAAVGAPSSPGLRRNDAQ